MKYILIFLTVFFAAQLSGQIHFSCKVLRSPTHNQRNEMRHILLKPRSDWPCAIKTIPVNFVFIQKDDGSWNWRESSNGLGQNTNNGYDFAHASIDKLNEELKKNIKMTIPPGNSTPVIPKNYRFVVHGVYFVKNSLYNDYNSGVLEDSILPYTTIVPDSHFTVFIQSDTSSNLGGGQAWSASATDKVKYTNNNGWGGYYRSVRIDKMSLKDAFEKITQDESGVLNHELLHLLTLDHTVKNGLGCNCPCKKMPVLYDTIFRFNTSSMKIDTITHHCSGFSNNGIVDTTCNDICDDTPSAWYMVDSINSPMHPGVNDPNKHPQFFTWFSNNRMEYTGYSALSKCQIEQLNNALEDPMQSYLICHKLKTNRNLCGFNNYITSYYGRDISINKNCGLSFPLLVNSNRYVKTISSGNVEIFNNFEVKDKAYFEVINDCACEF